jgi:hypothetical protein
VREALLLLALAFAAGGGAEGSRLAARAFASALGTEAARFGASFSGIGVDSIFDRDSAFDSSAACFILRRCASLNNIGSGFLNLLALILPLPGGGGGPSCGGGAIPAGVSAGPGFMCSINSLGLVFPTTRNPFAVFRTATIFTAFPPVAFPPLTLAVIGVAPGPGGPGGGCPPPCSTSMCCVPSGGGLDGIA